MSTYTSSLGLEEITPGSQAGLWGNTTNNNLILIDQAVTGVTPLSFAGVSGTTIVLDGAVGTVNTARSAVLNITGAATGANTVVIPNVQKTYLVRNNTGQSITFQTAAPGDVYAVLSGNSILIFCDGNNNVYTGIVSPSSGTLTVNGGGTGATTFTAGFLVSLGGTTALTTQPNIGVGGTSVTQISGQVQVPNGGTGLSNISTGALLAGNGIGAMSVLPTGNSGQVLTSNGAGANPSWQAAASAVYPGAGIAVSTGSSWTTSYSGGNPIPVSLGGTGATSFASAGLLTTSTGLQLTAANTMTGSGAISATASNSGDQRIGVQYGALSSGISPIGVQIGAGGWGFNYISGVPSISLLAGGGFVTSFSSTGNFQSNNSPNWAVTSDSNIKTNIRPISNALNKLNSLNPTHFEYKDKLGKTQTGFIAQEFETIFPGHTINSKIPENYKEFMPEGENIIKSLDLNLTAYLVKAIQELSAEVETLKAKVGA